MRLHSDARWSWGQVPGGKEQEAAQAAFVPAALGIRGRAPGEAVLGVHNRGQGVRDLTSAQRGRGGSIFTFPGFQCRLKKEVDSHQTGFLFRPFIRLFSAEQGQTSALERFFFFPPPHGVARSSCALTDLLARSRSL